LLIISVTNGVNRDKDTAFKNEASHELARAEVIDVLGHDNFLREVAKTRETPGRKAGRCYAPSGQVDTTHNVAEMTDSGWFAAGAAHLLFVHVFDDDFVAAPECMCWRSEYQGEQQNNACRFESIRFDRSGCMHALRLSVSVQMSVQNSKYTETRRP